LRKRGKEASLPFFLQIEIWCGRANEKGVAGMQATIKKEVEIQGIGLHKGRKVKLSFKPAPPNTGIIFVRVDKDKEIPAILENVSQSEREITLEKDGVRVCTVEHILSAFAGLGVDNAFVELDQDEPPVADGSSLPFCEAILEAEIEPFGIPKREISPFQPIWIKEKDRSISILPDQELRITYSIEFPYPGVGSQSASFRISSGVFMKEIAPARTFGFLEEIEPLQKRGFFKGGSLENAVVISKDGILNEEMRFEDEPVRHKILDLIGDLSLVGTIKGHIVATRSGHTLNIEFARRMKALVDGVMDINEIQKILPHRYPFLLVDRIVDMEYGKRIVGVKNVSYNEPFFRGHFPQEPIMPGVLIIEAMAQVGGILFLSMLKEEKRVYLAGIERVRFRRPVLPGDQLRIEVVMPRMRQDIAKMEAKAYVNHLVVAEAEFTLSRPRETE
jgi:UDP-3-O-[3-hydroxymyristoyl] N-acetylglucosamine deacetylase/3-hydroxyacyl-[acyl-carrier-protein] dehydratase